MPNIVPLDMPASYWRGKAQHAQKSGNLQEAVRLYRVALRKQADNATRRDLAQAYADMQCFSASDQLYFENLARDAGDTDSLYGLARNRSLMGDERGMADLLDLYLRLAPCGEQADRARDILWQMPRESNPKKRMRRAEVLCQQAGDHQSEPQECLRRLKRSWKRGKTVEAAQMLCTQYLQQGASEKALRYALAACNMAPQDINARFLLASALYQCKMTQGCRSALRQAQAMCVHPDQAPLFCRYALGLEQADLAVAFLEERLEKAPASIDVMIQLALALRIEGRDPARANELLQTAGALNEDDPVPRTLMSLPMGAEHDASLQMQQTLKLLKRVNSLLREELSPEELHDELISLLRLPMFGLEELAVRLLLQTGDVLGLRMALLSDGLQPMQYAVILNALEALHSPMPCFARVDGRLALLPQKPRPPYDGDLHDLIRRLLRDMSDPPLDLIVREAPPLWRRLPESARRHCAQSRDGVWPAAFAAYLTLCAHGAAAAEKKLSDSKLPRRTRRAYRQLIRRSNRPHEMH